MSKALHDLTVAELARGLKEKQFSAVELAQHFLRRIEHDSSGSFLTALTPNPSPNGRGGQNTLTPNPSPTGRGEQIASPLPVGEGSGVREAALAQAQRADARRAAGRAGELEGVPLAHKDIFVTRDFVTTAGSKMLEGYRSPFDATAVRRLGVEGAQDDANATGGAGMVCLGKLNCDEFAMGSGNENSAYGVVKNPWDAQRVPGGSSGGSAAAIAARLVPAATGTDTGGSIRQPAGFCGITGIKPTYGRISRYGMIAYASKIGRAHV